VIQYEVEDVTGATNVQNTTIQITIIPVNDPPLLLRNIPQDSFFRSNPIPFPNTDGAFISATFSYSEDDPPLALVPDVYLRDFDSNISTATLLLESECIVISPPLLPSLLTPPRPTRVSRRNFGRAM
jgi:hypothetical protein